MEKIKKYYKCLDCKKVWTMKQIPDCKCPNLTIIEED